MQVNNTEFFTPGGGSATTTAERPDDGLFDALLREEEARYEEAPPRDSGRSDDHWRDDDRPDHYRTDERPSDGHRDDDYHDDDYRDDYGEARDRGGSAGNNDHEEPDAPSGVDGRADAQEPAPKERSGPANGDAAVERPDGSVAQNDTAPETRPAAGKSETQTATAKDDPKGPPVGAATDQAAGMATVPADQATAPLGGAQTTSGATAPAGAASNNGSSSANAVASAAAAQSAAGNAAQSASGTASNAKSAAPDKTAGKAGPTAAEGQKATNQPASATGNQTTAAANGKPAIDDLLVTTSNAGLTSRPAAALGGAAATAVIAEGTKATATNANSGDRNKAKAGDGLFSAVNDPQKATAAKAGQMTDPTSAVAKDGKQSATSGAPGNLTSDSLNIAGSGGQSQPATASAIGNGFGGGSVQTASFSEALNTARGGGTPAPAEQIAVQVHKAQLAGKDQLNIKLHPAELGRIEVKLENRDDGVLRVVISAERSETLDLLQRDSRGLERALQDAGVKTDSGSLSFNLKGQQQSGQEHAAGQSPNPAPQAEAELDDPAASPPPPALARHDGALDIRV